MVLTEFFDSNTHRCYPFTKVNDLPTDLIVDANFLVTDNVSKDGLYISKVVISQDSIQVYLACTINNEFIDLGLLTTVPSNIKPYTESCCTIVNDTYQVIVQGSITLGYTDTVLNKTKFNQLDSSVYTLGVDGNIISQRVTPVTEWCTGLIINDKLYTGNVTLEVGEGLELQESNGILTLSAKGLTTPTAEMLTDEEIIQELLKRVGTGVTSINGCTGDITISTGSYTASRPVADGTDANNIQITTNGNSIIISNYVDNPLYDANQGTSTPELSYINTLLANARALNDRLGAVEQHNYAMDNAVNLLGAQLAKVD